MAWWHSVPGASAPGGIVFRGHSVPEAFFWGLQGRRAEFMGHRVSGPLRFGVRGSEGTVFGGVPRAQCSGGTVSRGA